MSPATGPFDGLEPAELRARGTRKWNDFDHDVLALWVAEMDFPTAPVVVDAITDAVRREQFGYPSRDADDRLRAATARWQASRYGWEVDPRRVHPVGDVLKGVEIGIGYFSPERSPVVLPTPAYMPFFEIPPLVARPIVEVPMLQEEGRFVLDLEGIDAAFAGGAGVLILCNPYNPLGRAFSRTELRALAEVVEGHGARVVADEIHGPLTYERPHTPYASVSEAAAGHTVTVVSASKAWNLPGLKCAQVILSNQADEERWRRVPRLAANGSSTIGIEANVAAYERGAPWLESVLGYLDRNRHLLAKLLAERLPDARYVLPEATYLAWIDFRGYALPLEPAAFLLERARVALNLGVAFGANGRGHARLNFATSASILEEAIERIAVAMEGRLDD